MPTHRILLAAACVFVSVITSGCDGVSHENIDNWLTTQRGPDKLVEALNDSGLEPDMRAHAAANLVLLDKWSEVRKTLEAAPESKRTAVADALAARLWKASKIDGEMTQPTDRQWASKDAMYELRTFASDATREQLDKYLVEWFADGFYEGRATTGRATGRMVIRAVGAAAAPKLLERARSILARPPKKDGTRLRVGDELLHALALSGDSEAVGFLLDLVVTDYKDETLPKRAMGALNFAYVDPVGVDKVPPDALAEHIESLVALTRDEDAPGVMKNDAVYLLSAIGMPRCLEPFVSMISYPHRDRNFIWIGAQQGIRCGGVDSIVPVVDALPPGQAYERGMLARYVWDEITAHSARGVIAQRARTLLESPNWVSRVTGIELLAKLELPATAAEDAKKIRALASDRTVLKGWWGKQDDVPKAERKKDPTLGEVATKAANELEKVAK